MRIRYVIVLFVLIGSLFLASCGTQAVSSSPLATGTATPPPSATYAPTMAAMVAGDMALDPMMLEITPQMGMVSTMPAATQPAPGSPQLQPQIQPQIQPQKRVVLKNASFTATVKDVPTTLASIGTLAEEFGGWIVSSTTHQGPGRYYPKLIFGTITVRVPADRFTATMERIRSGAVSIDNEDIRGDDVTQQYADLTSRASNLESAESQLRSIMDEAATTDEVLNVYRELTRIRGEIEQIKGQLKYFDEASAYSSITVNLLPFEEPPPVTPTLTPSPTPYAGWQAMNTVNRGVDILTNFLQGLVDAIILFTIVILPVLLPITLIVWVLIRRMRRSRRSRSMAESAPTPEA